MKPTSKSPLANAGIISLLALFIILLQACGIRSQHMTHADPGKQSRTINVTSTPSGAIVRADGKNLGNTPLTINLDRAFSAEWVSGESYGVDYRVNGELTIEKPGCKTFLLPVSDTEPAKDISVTLSCDKQAEKASQPEQPEKLKQTDQRLKKLETLYQNGSISEDEYKQHRTRILNEL